MKMFFPFDPEFPRDTNWLKWCPWWGDYANGFSIRAQVLYYESPSRLRELGVRVLCRKCKES